MSTEWAVGIIVFAIVMVSWGIIDRLRVITQQLARISGLISEAKHQWDEDAGRNELRYRAGRSSGE